MGAGETGIHLATVFIFARMTGKTRFFSDVSGHLFSEFVLLSGYIFLLFPMIVAMGSRSDPRVAGGNPRPSTLSDSHAEGSCVKIQ